MKIVVCVKQVPDTTEVEVDKKTGTIIREGVPSILNPFDEFALNLALDIKKETEGTIVVLSMGPPQAEDALKKCLAIGADEAILLSDRAFAGSDTWATSLALADAIALMDDVGLVLCGQQAIDGDTAQVGPEMAQHLEMPHVSYVEEIREISKKSVICKKEVDAGYHIIKCKMPAVITCLATSDFQPKIPSIMEIMKAKRKKLEVWDCQKIGGDADRYGLTGSLTQVVKSYAPSDRGECVMVNEMPEEAVKQILQFLSDEGVIG